MLHKSKVIHQEKLGLPFSRFYPIHVLQTQNIRSVNRLAFGRAKSPRDLRVDCSSRWQKHLSLGSHECAKCFAAGLSKADNRVWYSCPVVIFRGILSYAEKVSAYSAAVSVISFLENVKHIKSSKLLKIVKVVLCGRFQCTSQIPKIHLSGKPDLTQPPLSTHKCANGAYQLWPSTADTLLKPTGTLSERRGRGEVARSLIRKPRYCCGGAALWACESALFSSSSTHLMWWLAMCIYGKLSRLKFGWGISACGNRAVASAASHPEWCSVWIMRMWDEGHSEMISSAVPITWTDPCCVRRFFFFFYFTLNETSISKGTVQHSEVSEVLLPCRLWSRHASVHSRNVKWQQAEVDCWDETLHAEAFAGAHGLLNIPGLTVSNSRSVWS